MSLYTKEEIVAVKTLRSNLKDLNLDEHKKNSGYLIRWLRARDMNVSKAEDMLRKSLEWREKENIDSILNWCPPIEIQNLAKIEMCGFDNENCPIFITTYNGMEGFKTCDLNLLLKYNVYMSERTEALINSSSKTNKQLSAIFILDVSNVQFLNFLNLTCLKYFGQISQLLGENYPEIPKKIYVTYAPNLCAMFFSMIKHLVPKYTLEKIKIYGDNLDVWKHELLLDIPMDQLPLRFGGTNLKTLKIS